MTAAQRKSWRWMTQISEARRPTARSGVGGVTATGGGGVTFYGGDFGAV